MTSPNQPSDAQSQPSLDQGSHSGQDLENSNDLQLTEERALQFVIVENGSDYGDFASDQEELDIIDALLSQVESQAAPLLVTDIEDYEGPRGVRLPKILGIESKSRWQALQTKVLRDYEASDSAKRPAGEARKKRPSAAVESQPRSNEPDTRSPLERFRRPPQKALSVTDLISPAWCELQYFYTLSKHGRKRRTPAMKQGTAVHQALEDEVHTTVPVEITKKEDGWGLRIWNIIQGLRTLRETGRTRELEIWGSIGGEIVNGVIDELSYTSPDPKLESTYDGAGSEKNVAPEYQTSINAFLLSAGPKEQGFPISDAASASRLPRKLSKQERSLKCIYITDYKTRKTPTLPAGPYVEPTVLQLHLYHHMLENLAQGNFSLVQLAERYELDTNDIFSDSFIAQVGNLNQPPFDAAPEVLQNDIIASQFLSSQDSMDIILHHNSLSTLWSFMMSQFRETFLLPLPAASETPTPTPQSISELDPPTSNPTRLSPLLTAEYIATDYYHAKGNSKNSIGKKSFIFKPAFLRQYLEQNLAFWRGEREPKGVELQEAFKCRMCDYRDDCSWIHERDAANVAEAMERKKMREVAGLEGKTTTTAKSTV